MQASHSCFAAALAGFVLIASSYASPVQARRLGGFFGPDETIHMVAPSGVKAEVTPLSICYKDYTYYLLAGVYTTSELVLCEGEGSKRYFPMPTGETLADLQKERLLPTPLPGYTRDWSEYAIGYSLWLLIGAIGLLTWFISHRKKTEAENNSRLIKLMARRIMAHMSSGADTAETGRNVAANVYQGLFNETLPEAEFAADAQWVADNPAAYEGFIKAMSRKFDGKSKAVLLRAATYVVLADGTLDIGETQALRHLASCMGMSDKDTEEFIATISRASAAPPAG